MAIPSLDGLTVAELQELVSLVVSKISAMENDKAQEHENAKESIVNSRATLEGLLGAVDAAPGTSSIRAVLAYGDQTIMENSAVATPLIVQALDILTSVMIDITKALDD